MLEHLSRSCHKRGNDGCESRSDVKQIEKKIGKKSTNEFNTFFGSFICIIIHGTVFLLTKIHLPIIDSIMFHFVVGLGPSYKGICKGE